MNDLVDLSRLVLECDGYAVLPLTGFAGDGPDLVGFDDHLGMLGVVVATSYAGLFPKLVAVMLSPVVADLVARGRLRVVGHLCEGNRVTRIVLRLEDFR